MTASGRAAMRTRVALLASVLALILPFVTGCTGDGESAAFQREFADAPEIESMELTSHDNQPFTGGVSGEIVAQAGLTDDEFMGLASRVGDYTRENDERMQGRVSLIVDGFEMIVTGASAFDDGAARSLLALRADVRALSAVVSESSITVVGVGGLEAIELMRELPALLDDVALRLPSTLAVRSEDHAVDVRGSPIASATAVRVWDAFALEVPLAGIRAREDERLVVTLKRETDLPIAEQVAARATPQWSEPVAFASDLIRLGDSDGADARLLLSRLDDDLRAQVAHVWISGAQIQVTVRSEAALSAMAGTLDAALPTSITEASVMLEGDPETRVKIRSESEEAGDSG